MIRKPCFILLLGSLLVFSAAAQDLSPSSRRPVADGILKPGEYGFTGTYADMRLGATLSADRKTLYLALEAPTAGWVAIGLGSPKMDGSFMAIGSVSNGAPSVSEQRGAGHGHRPNAVRILTESTVRETAGVTVLEIALPAAEFASGGALQLILSYGSDDSIVVKHTAHASVELSIRK